MLGWQTARSWAARQAAAALGPELRQIAGKWFRIELPGSAGASVVTYDGALALSAAYSAINRISSDVALMTLNLYRMASDGGRTLAESDPLHELTAITPDGGQTTALDFRQTQMAHVLGHGKSFARIHWMQGGRAAELELLDPRDVQVRRREADRRLYFEPVRGRTLRSDEVIYLRGLSLDGLDCLTPIRLHRETFELALEAQGYGRTLFSNASVPRGILKFPRKLGKDGRKNLRESFEEAHSGRAGWNRIAVLEEGADWIKTGIDPDDAQFLSTREFQVKEVARIFSIPPWKIGDYSEVAYNSIEASNIDYVTTTLMTWVVKTEATYNMTLLTRRERRNWRFITDLSVLLRGDMNSRADFYEKMRRMGIYHANDIASREGLNPIPAEEGGFKRIVPVNMTTLERVGQPNDEPSRGQRAES